MIYRLPPTFYDDHVSRDLPGGAVVRRNKIFVYAELTEDEVAEIQSDAEYYATEMMENARYDRDEWLLAICKSARSTVEAIAKQVAR